MDNHNEPFKGEESYYGSQKLRHQSFWQRYRWFVVIGSLVTLLAFFAATTFYLLVNRTPATNTITSSSPNAPSQTSSTNNSGPNPSVPGTNATPTALATVPAGTFTEPNGGLKLHTNADDPVTVTITSMTYNPAENKMVWSLVVKNVSASGQYLYTIDFTLKSDAEGDNNTHQAQAQTSGIEYTDIPPGNQIQMPITFTFVPYQKASGVSYTLTSIIRGAGTITFDPITMTF